MISFVSLLMLAMLVSAVGLPVSSPGIQAEERMLVSRRRRFLTHLLVDPQFIAFRFPMLISLYR
ncbi:MAG: hypothetical protein ACLR6B_01035 [Blautia sp.]